MPELGWNGDRLPRLEAELENAIVLVAGEYEEILAFKGLMLTLLRRPAMDMHEVRAELNRFAAVEAHYSQIGRDSSENWKDEVSRLLDTAFSSLSPPRPLPPISSLVLAMATGVLLWQQEQSSDQPILLVLSVSATGDQSTPGHLKFDRPRAGLIFEPGSLRVRQVLTNAIGVVGWFVGIFRNSAGRVLAADTVARGLVENLRDARAQEDPPPIELPRLDTMQNEDLPKDNGGIVLLFLHGLMSTDLGNFDGLIKRLQAPTPRDLKRELPPEITSEDLGRTFNRAVKLVGWPHDTLTSVNSSAHQLSRLIEEKLASSGCKLVFVCHSRGGLVARATALKLYEHADEWSDRIRCCITFGTPHAGVGLAEHPDRRMGAYILCGMMQGQLAAYAEIAAYIEQRERIEGIEDLRPASAVGKPYLQRLEDEEWKIPPPPRGRRRQLEILAIGGIAPSSCPKGDFTKRLIKYYSYWYSYYSGEEHHDLVVPLASATAANEGRRPPIMNCDHFHYFRCGNPKSDAVTEAVSLVWEKTGLIEQLPKAEGIPDLVGELERHLEGLKSGARKRQSLEELKATLLRAHNSIDAISSPEEVVQILSDNLRKFPPSVRELAEGILESLRPANPRGSLAAPKRQGRPHLNRR